MRGDECMTDDRVDLMIAGLDRVGHWEEKLKDESDEVLFGLLGLVVGLLARRGKLRDETAGRVLRIVKELSDGER